MCSVCRVLVCLLAVIKMSTNSELDLNIIFRKSLNKSSGNIQIIVMLMVAIVVKMMLVIKIMIMRVRKWTTSMLCLLCSCMSAVKQLKCPQIPNLTSRV